MLARAAAVAAFGAALLLAACDNAPSYKTNRDDGEYDTNGKYDLQLMLLRNADLPEGMALRREMGFDNESWAEATSEDPEKTVQRLDSWQRVRNHVAIFQRGDPEALLGKTFRVTSQATLYKDAAAATRSLSDRGQSCGTAADDTKVQDFAVPRIGEQSLGFFVVHEEKGAPSTIETTVCFRTGRIVHAVTQTGFNGSQDLGQNVRLAMRQLHRVEDTLAGKRIPQDEPEEDNG